MERNYERNGLPFEMAAFDLDGTLMRFDAGISDDTRVALNSLRERGVKVVLATGRRYEGAKEHAERLGFAPEDPLVCYGGSMIRSISGETTRRSVMTVEDGIEVLEWTEEHDLHARILVDGGIVASPNTPAVFSTMTNFIEDGLMVVESPLAWLEENREEPIRVNVVDVPGEIEAWLGDAEDAFSNRLFITRSLPHYVEFGSLGGNKSAALNTLCERWNIDPS
ncbi:MAG: HAD-IIB family hydrolase, partial [Rubrobacteraceae bacterium]